VAQWCSKGLLSSCTHSTLLSSRDAPTYSIMQFQRETKSHCTQLGWWPAPALYKLITGHWAASRCHMQLDEQVRAVLVPPNPVQCVTRPGTGLTFVASQVAVFWQKSCSLCPLGCCWRGIHPCDVHHLHHAVLRLCCRPYPAQLQWWQPGQGRDCAGCLGTHALQEAEASELLGISPCNHLCWSVRELWCTSGAARRVS
jgi:hypothetical protein